MYPGASVQIPFRFAPRNSLSHLRLDATFQLKNLLDTRSYRRALEVTLQIQRTLYNFSAKKASRYTLLTSRTRSDIANTAYTIQHTLYNSLTKGASTIVQCTFYNLHYTIFQLSGASVQIPFRESSTEFTQPPTVWYNFSTKDASTKVHSTIYIIQSTLYNVPLNLLQRLWDSVGVFAAGGGEKGLAAAAALNVFSKFANDRAGVQFFCFGEVFVDVTA